jgi:hypothetical protein
MNEMLTNEEADTDDRRHHQPYIGNRYGKCMDELCTQGYIGDVMQRSDTLVERCRGGVITAQTRELG